MERGADIAILDALQTWRLQDADLVRAFIHMISPGIKQFSANSLLGD